MIMSNLGSGFYHTKAEEKCRASARPVWLPSVSFSISLASIGSHFHILAIFVKLECYLFFVLVRSVLKCHISVAAVL